MRDANCINNADGSAIRQVGKTPTHVRSAAACAIRAPLARHTINHQAVGHRSNAEEISAQTKREFANYLRTKRPQLGGAIVAVENADHPTDAEVLAYARRHFKGVDRMFAPNA